MGRNLGVKLGGFSSLILLLLTLATFALIIMANI